MLCVCNIKIAALIFFLFYTVISSQLCFKSQKHITQSFLGYALPDGAPKGQGVDQQDKTEVDCLHLSSI